MLDRIVFDVEIQKTIEETPGGWDSTHLLGISVCVVYEYLSDRFRIYGPDDIERLQQRLMKADELIGFNVVGFDLPVIFGFSKSAWLEAPLRASLLPKTNDLLRRIWLALDLDPDIFVPATHGGWSLNAICKETLGGVGKIGYGGDAPKWYQAGQWARLVNYCCDDVALERDLTDFVDRYGYVLGPNGRRVELR